MKIVNALAVVAMILLMLCVTLALKLHDANEARDAMRVSLARAVQTVQASTITMEVATDVINRCMLERTAHEPR
jgi:hypothetical protein